MPALLTTPSSPASELDAVTTQNTARRNGEFIMAGSLTPTGDPEPGTLSSPETVMPNYADREEVQTVLTKLRESVSLWKRIPNAPPGAARDSVAHLVLPQHTMFIK